MSKRHLLVSALIAFTISGCATQTSVHENSFAQMPLSAEYSSPFAVGLSSHIEPQKLDSITRQVTAEGVKYLESGDYDKASELFNSALRLDLTNSYIQLLNAITYHMQAVQGDTEKFDLAVQGYQMALRFEPTNWLAKYYLGLAYIDQREFSLATQALMNAAILNPEDPGVLYDLARASYYAQDAKIANSAITKLQVDFPQFAKQPKVVRAAAMTQAALGNLNEANELFNEYSELADARNTRYLSSRLSAWENNYAEQSDAKFQTTALQSRTIPGAANPRRIEQDIQEEGDFDADMVVVDVVIIRTQEDVSTTKGFNMLSGLQLQFGDPLSNTPGIAFDRLKTYGDTSSDSSAITQLISMPSVNYSLNIFNTLAGRNEILARPSLVALQGQTSEFFSGVDVVAAAVSGGDGSAVSISKEIGVKLAVKPEFLSEDQVRLEVEAERTFLTTPSSSVVFEFRLDTSKTTVNANVVMNFGETLVLSGLSEEESEESRDSVPFLGDIPVLQYLFAKQGTREFRKSVIILLTPRRTHYVNRDPQKAAEAEAKLNDFERTVQAYENRFENYFTPRSTMTDVLTKANKNQLFSDFKHGDFELEGWHRRDTHTDRLKHALDFLFY